MTLPRLSLLLQAASLCALCLTMASCQKQDQDPPVLRLNGPTTLVLPRGTAYTEQGYMAFDDADYELTNQVIVTTDIDTHRIGDYHVNYQVADQAGHTATASRTVRVAHTLQSLVGQYRSASSFNFCPTSGIANISRANNYPNLLYLSPAVGSGFNGNLIQLTLTGYPDYRLQSSYGHLPCGYQVSQGLGDITPDGDSIHFTCKVTSDINTSNFYFITIDYTKR